MKKIFALFAFVSFLAISGCSSDDDFREDRDTISEVFQLTNVNFAYNANDGYNIYRDLDPLIFNEDVVLIYRRVGSITDTGAPIWQQIPRTIYTDDGEIDYDFDFSVEHFIIYARATYNLALTPSYLNNQTFRIVIVPGSPDGSTSAKLANKTKEDYSDYNAVIKKYNIDDTNVIELN
ncbi:hypothetical protein [Flavobacterium seoulense]|uniref:Lipoprotein n=1 Tax=Flavobacterium seoulense TaxID=1492738 RepID=A0A066WZA6_9FLAO|nr:hypothetical protein [Flavobacterium seoulense]KDN56005.1 hypothetical protein FEM21_09040 [Flavobacterium seoulense]